MWNGSSELKPKGRRDPAESQRDLANYGHPRVLINHHANDARKR